MYSEECLHSHEITHSHVTCVPLGIKVIHWYNNSLILQQKIIDMQNNDSEENSSD